MNFPLDIIIDILCRQPVKSLLRFRCLSKIFCSLIDSPDFVKLHLACSNGRKLILTDTPDGNIFSMDLNSADDPVHMENPLKCFGSKTESDILGSCNGLIALKSKKDYVLWNPSTKKHHKLLKFPIDPEHFGPFSLTGFGYDAASDDYKLVQVVSTYRWDTFSPLGAVVLINSLKKRTWKAINDFPFIFTSDADPGALVGSALNWMVIESIEYYSLDGWYKQVILAFDLTTEKFFSVPEPDNIISDKLYKKTVGVLEGCLTVASPLDGRFDVWLMKEYGVKESWTKLFSFMLSEITYFKSYVDWLTTLAYSNSGRKVLIMLKNAAKGSYCVSWYNLEDQKAAETCFRIHIEPQSTPMIVDCSEGYAGPFREVICLDSLVSPYGYTRKGN